MVVVAGKLGRPANKELQEKRRVRILKTAARLFSKNGFAGTDLNDLAKAVKLSKGAIYYYFSNKEELFLATVDSMMGQLLDAMNQVLESDRPPLSIITDGVEAYLGFCEKNPQFVELLIQERAIFSGRQKPTYFSYKESNSEPWHKLYDGLMKTGVIRTMPTDRIMNVTCDLLYGVIFTNHFSGRERKFKDQTSDIVDVLFNGILTKKGLKVYKEFEHG